MINTTKITPFFPPLPLLTDRSVYNYMSTPTIYGLLRQLVQETGGPYLEVGSYRGQSLLAAGSGTDIECIGIDNFTGTGYRADNEPILMEQIAPYDNIRFFKMHYQEGFEAVKKMRKKFGVIFLDGPHGERETLEQLELAAKLVKKGGFIVVDDFNQIDVDSAFISFMVNNKSFDAILEEKTQTKQDPTWWNGIAVIQKG